MSGELPARLEIVPFDGPIAATPLLSGSKSITNRALLIAALADGRSTLHDALLADDTEAMLACVRGLGASVSVEGTRITVDGIGGDLRASSPALDVNQSGTTARFIAAVLLLGRSAITLDGHPAMRRRPMGPTIDALRTLGATVVERGAPGHLPLEITGAAGETAWMPTVVLRADESSQFASGLLIAAACLPHGLRIELDGPVVSRPYLRMTAAVMAEFGARVTTDDERVWTVAPGGYSASDLRIEPDASAASYVFAAAAIVGGTVTVTGLGSASIQGDVGFVDVLRSMGAVVDMGIGSTTVTGAPLHGIEVDMADISDTAQTLAAVAVFAEGPTRLTGIGFIRAKETDRIGALVTELGRLGIGAVEEDDGLSITPGVVHGAVVHTYDDHRMAMSLSLIGLRVPGVVIDDPGCVRKTFPTYFDVLESMRPGGAR